VCRSAGHARKEVCVLSTGTTKTVNYAVDETDECGGHSSSSDSDDDDDAGDTFYDPVLLEDKELGYHVS